MSLMRQCGRCGASLDPGEICDCGREEASTPDAIAAEIATPSFGMVRNDREAGACRAESAELAFRSRPHIYMLGGQRIPCVSDLCRFLHREVYKDAPAWQMEAAADRGTKVHAATEMLDITGRAEIEGEYAPYLQAYAAFRREHEVLWEMTEKAMYHPELLYAGTIDRYGLVDGLRTLIDIKTTYTVHKPLCHASLNLYRMMLEAREKAVDRLLILQLKKDGGYRLVAFDRDDAVPMALILLHNHLKKKRRK